AGYQWRSARGLEIVSVAIQSVEYDEDTRKLLSDVKKADALSGNRGGSFLQQSVARGFEAAGEGGGGNMAMMGMVLGMTGQALNFQQQQVPQQAAPAAPAPAAPAEATPPAAAAEDPVAKLAQYKQMLDQGLITPED